MRKLLARAAVALVASGLAVAAVVLEPPGAQRAALAQESAGVTGPQCVLKGTFPISKGVQLYDAAMGGRPLATFTGAFVPMKLTDFGADPTATRVHLATANDAPALRIGGWVAASTLSFFTARDLPVVSGHVWITSAQRVRFVGAATNALTAELTIAGSMSQKIRATAACDAFSVEKGVPRGQEPSGNARGYLMRGADLELYDEPNGSAVFTLHMTEGTGQLFWSNESRAGFVHVTSRGDVAVDAWARFRDLEPLKKGEMLDQLIPPSSAVTGAQMALDKAPPLVRATKDVPVRAKRDAKEAPIGAIEAGAEIYLMETMAGWTNVLPKGLGFTPADDAGFWIPSGEAPK
jgi:hypothetical protein